MYSVNKYCINYKNNTCINVTDFFKSICVIVSLIAMPPPTPPTELDSQRPDRVLFFRPRFELLFIVASYQVVRAHNRANKKKGRNGRNKLLNLQKHLHLRVLEFLAPVNTSFYFKESKLKIQMAHKKLCMPIVSSFRCVSD